MIADERARLDATVRGRVQGVGFRYFVLRRALDLGLEGWVANEFDGSVRCVAEGSTRDLGRFVADLELGPPGALVERVITAWGPAVGGLGSFTIKSAAHRGD